MYIGITKDEFGDSVVYRSAAPTAEGVKAKCPECIVVDICGAFKQITESATIEEAREIANKMVRRLSV